MKRIVFALVIVTLLFSFGSVFASTESELIGTIRSAINEIQRLPSEIYDAICDDNVDLYNSKMQELGAAITQANNAMAEAGLPNTLNLWASIQRYHRQQGLRRGGYCPEFSRPELRNSRQHPR